MTRSFAEEAELAEMQRTGMRVCKDCGIPKPLADFPRHVTSLGGILARCKTCQQAVDRHRRRNRPQPGDCRVCTCCRESLPPSDFDRAANNRFLKKRCRKCEAEIAAIEAAEPPSALNARRDPLPLDVYIAPYFNLVAICPHCAAVIDTVIDVDADGVDRDRAVERWYRLQLIVDRMPRKQALKRLTACTHYSTQKRGTN